MVLRFTYSRAGIEDSSRECVFLENATPAAPAIEGRIAVVNRT